jgi:hypothetical protein
MDLETADTGHGDAPPETYVECGYPQFDCLGCYMLIWERLIQTTGGTEVDARHIRRNPPPNSAQPT